MKIHSSAFMLSICETLLCGVSAIAADTWTMMNPTGMNYSNELVRIKVNVPEGASRETLHVTEDGREIAWQAEQIDGKLCAWVCTDLTNGQTHVYRVISDQSSVISG